VVLEKDGEDQLGRSCEKLTSITKSQAGGEYPTNSKKKECCVGHILPRGCLRKHPTEGIIERCIEVTGKRGRRRSHLLDEKRGYWKLKEEALDHTLWRTRFGRGCEPVVRDYIMNE
jgi:hypothetical protein